jgi:hypothetical protein
VITPNSMTAVMDMEITQAIEIPKAK